LARVPDGALLSKSGFAFVFLLLALVRTPVAAGFGKSSLATTFDALLKEAPRATPRALLMALTALKPSSEPRLWVFDLDRKHLLFEEPVAHGKNSGGERSIRFSNKPGTLMSSLGVFLTADTYIGKHGLSLRLRGMEEGINDLSMERDIVIHAASYVRRGGRIGRSWGCPAVRPEISRALIESVRGGTLLLSYYPEPSWLQASTLAGTARP
jgi:L,D-transpeptidase catalytic domain